jgi:hypothetical protein
METSKTASYRVISVISPNSCFRKRFGVFLSIGRFETGENLNTEEVPRFQMGTLMTRFKESGLRMKLKNDKFISPLKKKTLL